MKLAPAPGGSHWTPDLGVWPLAQPALPVLGRYSLEKLHQGTVFTAVLSHSNGGDDTPGVM
ncbi:MAG: hypothetical protein ACYCV7_05745 [Acidimicrobiales bacterium]